jgi:carbonic anhydrase
MDARVPIERLLGLEEGDAHVIRNAGALVTDDVQRSLATSRKLGTEKTALILHTDCGARQGEDLDASVREAAAQLEAPVRMYVYDVESRELREVR